MLTFTAGHTDGIIGGALGNETLTYLLSNTSCPYIGNFHSCFEVYG
jgi:hypothetical protein